MFNIAFCLLILPRTSSCFRADQSSDYFAYMTKHGGGEMPDYKKLRLHGYVMSAGTKNIQKGDGDAMEPGAEGEEKSNDDAGDEEVVRESTAEVEGTAGDGSDAQPTVPGFWWTQGKRRIWIATVSWVDEMEEDDELSDTVTLAGTQGLRMRDLPFPDFVRMKIECVNIMVCASGQANCGHQRSRMKLQRDEWLKSDVPQEREAAASFTMRLSLAEDALCLAQAANVHSLCTQEFQTKRDCLIAAGIVFPASLAYEVTIRTANEKTSDLLSGAAPFLDVARIVMPYDASGSHAAGEDDDDIVAAAVDDDEEWSPCDPRMMRIPGTPHEKTIWLEQSIANCVVIPMLKQWGRIANDSYISILCDIESCALRQPVNLNVVISQSCNQIVKVCRGIRFVVEGSLGARWESHFDFVQNAKAQQGAWAGFAYAVQQAMNHESEFIKSIILEIRKTRPTHNNYVTKITSLNGLLHDANDLTAKMEVAIDVLNELQVLQTGTRRSSVDVLVTTVTEVVDAVVKEASGKVQSISSSAGDIDRDHVPSDQEIAQFTTVLNFLKTVEAAPIDVKSAWRGCRVLLEEKLPKLQFEASQHSFLPTMETMTVEALIDDFQREHFSVLLNQALNATSGDELRKGKITAAAAKLLSSIESYASANGYTHETVDKLLDVFPRLINFLAKAAQPNYVSVCRLMTLSRQGCGLLHEFVGLAESPAKRLEVACCREMLGRLHAARLELSETLPANDELITEGNGVKDLIERISDIVAKDATQHYVQLHADIEAFFQSPIASELVPFSQIFKGGLDGSDWHEQLKALKSNKQVLQLAKKTVLTLPPTGMKAAALKYKELLSEAKSVRERFNLTIIPAESSHCDNCQKACVTVKEATMLALVVKHNAEENVLQRKCRSEKASAEKTTNAFPRTWDDIHEKIKAIIDKAISLEDLEI